eukprot:3646741-Prorocentrum_lima.AAC.1
MGAGWEKAIELLASMAHVTVEASEISYNAAISACERGVEWEKAIELLARMAHVTVEANEISYNAS